MINKLTFSHLHRLRHLLVFVVILLTAVAVGIANILGENNNYNPDNKTSCWLAGNSCEIELAEGTLTVVMDRLPTIEEQIPLTVTLPEGVQINSAYIEGVNMFMGKIPVPLKQENNRQWQGWFMLGACAEPTMQWQMVIKIKNRPEPVWIFFTTTM